LSARRPNILVIVTDDQHYGTLELVDPTTSKPWMAKTLGWFGAAGMSTTFSTAFDTTPLCCPSRASLMTGRYAHNHGVLGNDDKDALDHATTIQCLLKSQPEPYYAGIFGKFLNNWVTLGGDPPANPPYFDEWTIWDNGTHVATTPAPPRPDPPTIRGVDCINDQGELIQIPPDSFETTFLADRATDFIRRRAREPDAPWFLYLAPTPPHWPFRPEEQYATTPVPEAVLNASNMPEADVTDKPPYVQNRRAKAEAFSRDDKATWPQAGRCARITTEGLAGFTECVLEVLRPDQLRLLKSVDDMVGRVVIALEETNQAADTLAFFTADHGYLWNEHGLDGKPHPYCDMKVPLVMRWQNGDLHEAFDHSLVANIDLAPTVLAAAGIPIPPTIDGHDLLAADRRPRERLMLEFRERWASIVTPGLQYTEWYDRGAPMLWSEEYPARADSPPGTPVREYYDLESDPLELTNILHDGDVGNDPSDEALEALQRQLAADRDCAGRGAVPGRPPCP
jgi:arylsulfatase A-like enzyme